MTDLVPRTLLHGRGGGGRRCCGGCRDIARTAKAKGLPRFCECGGCPAGGDRTRCFLMEEGGQGGTYGMGDPRSVYRERAEGDPTLYVARGRRAILHCISRVGGGEGSAPWKTHFRTPPRVYHPGRVAVLQLPPGPAAD